MKKHTHNRLALLITILIMFCLLLAGGLFALFKIRSLPEEQVPEAAQDPAAWLGADTVLAILSGDTEQSRSAASPSMSSGAREGGAAPASSQASADAGASAANASTAKAASAKDSLKDSGEKSEQDSGQNSSQDSGQNSSQDSGQDSSRDSGQDSSQDSGQNAGKYAKKDPEALQASSESSGSSEKNTAKISRKSLTKLQKKHVESWEAYHGWDFPLNAPLNNYNWKYLKYDSHGVLQYEGDENYTVRHGIDVSEFQGKIDWDKVRADGYDFVFIRAGYRMFDTGTLERDSRAVKNLKAAKKAGFDVGVYLFSQAVSKKEARAEADLCLDVIEESGVEITLPVVFDPEIQTDYYYARINYISASQFTDNAVAFCEEIEKAGYTPAIYANSSTQTDILDMSRLTDAVLWSADYDIPPESPYQFVFWQYTEYGWVDGIPETETDLNLWFVENGDGETKEE